MSRKLFTMTVDDEKAVNAIKSEIDGFIKQVFSDRMEALYKESGLTPAAFARKINVGQSEGTKYVTKKMGFSIHVMAKALHFCNKGVDYVLKAFAGDNRRAPGKHRGGNIGGLSAENADGERYMKQFEHLTQQLIEQTREAERWKSIALSLDPSLGLNSKKQEGSD